MRYRNTIRIFEDSSIVNPDTAFHVRINNVVNTRNQEIRIVDMGNTLSYFYGSLIKLQHTEAKKLPIEGKTPIAKLLPKSV